MNDLLAAFLCVLLVGALLLGMSIASRRQLSDSELKELCTPLVLDEIVADNYVRQSQADRAAAEAQAKLAVAMADAESRTIIAQHIASGLNAVFYSVAFSATLFAVWTARHFWYWRMK